MTTRTFVRAPPAFDGPDAIVQILDWSERQGDKLPTVYRGPDGSARGSVEVAPAGELVVIGDLRTRGE